MIKLIIFIIAIVFFHSMQFAQFITEIPSGIMKFCTGHTQMFLNAGW